MRKIEFILTPTQEAYYNNGEYIQAFEIAEYNLNDLKFLNITEDEIKDIIYYAHYILLDDVTDEEIADDESCACDWDDWKNNYIYANFQDTYKKPCVEVDTNFKSTLTKCGKTIKIIEYVEDNKNE